MDEGEEYPTPILEEDGPPGSGGGTSKRSGLGGPPSTERLCLRIICYFVLSVTDIKMIICIHCKNCHI